MTTNGLRRLLLPVLALSLIGSGQTAELPGTTPSPGLQRRPDRASPVMARGELHAGVAYVCGTQRGQEVTPRGRGSLVVARKPLVETGGMSLHELSIIVIGWDDGSAPVRWHIDGGARLSVVQFWPLPSGSGARFGELRRVPVAKVAAFPGPFEGGWACEEAIEQFLLAYQSIRTFGRLQPLDDVLSDPNIEDRKSVQFDILAGPEDDWSCFVQSAGVMTRSDKLYLRQPDGTRQGVWGLTKQWRTAWSGPFHVHRQGQTCFFVAESGQVYAAKDQDADMKQVWSGKEPFTSLIFDTASGKAFAFTRTCFFEVKEKVEPVRCFDLSPHTDELDSALHCVIRCGRLLRQHKLIP